MSCYQGQPGIQVNNMMTDGQLEQREHLDEYTVNSNLRPQSTQSIAKWLDENYHYEDGICLPRSTIYDHYVDHCTRDKLQPVNAASFGKIIRQQYPSLTTRRLGTRGQSKYHYFGLGIKPTSLYYTADYVEKQHGQGTTRKETESKKTHAYYASKEKPSAVLPPFPNVNTMELPSSLSQDKLHTFMVMYRAHCQRILDSVVRATFSEVENFLYHFWQAMPSHLHPILATDIVTDLIAMCDTTLYKAISNVYISSPLQSIPENVAQEVHHFASNLNGWLESALKGLPDSLKTSKYQIAAVFKKKLKRLHSLMHLADATRNALHGDDPLEQLAEDFTALDIENILSHTLFAVHPLNLSQSCAALVPEFLDEFANVLTEPKTSVEDFIVWVEKVVHRCINKEDSVVRRKEVSRTFLLTWKFFTSKIVRELTLMSAPSFGTFHLIHMLIEDYIVHSLETLMECEKEKEFSERIHMLQTVEPLSEISQSASSSTRPSTSSTTDVPLIAEPPSSFGFTPDLTSHSRRSSVGDLSAPSSDQPFINMLSPTLDPMHTDNSLRGSRTSLSSTNLQQATRSDGQQEANTLQGLIDSHGITAYNNNPITSSQMTQSQGVLHQRQSLQQGMTDTTPTIQETTCSLRYSRHQDHSLPLNFVQSHGPQMNIGNFSLPPLALPSHLQSEHSLAFESSTQSLNGLLGDSSNQPRNLSILNPSPKDSLPSASHCEQPVSSLPGILSQMPVSLPHPIMAAPGNLPSGLPNPSSLPIFPGMPNMYSYPYPSTLSSQPPTSSIPSFPPQGILSRYPSPYVPPTLYGNSQPPIMNRR